MHFTKMHGIGNDYVYVDCTKEHVDDPEAVAKMVSDRHFGIGSDGLILIKPSDIADFEMDMYNADGSRGKMCGNGIRCVGKYVYDHGLTDKTVVKIATGAGVKTLVLTVEDGKVALVRVNMGGAILKPEDIPTKLSDENGKTAINAALDVDGKNYAVTCVSMGNPHCVTFMDALAEVENLEIEKVGPKFENHEVFPDRVNTEFVYALDEHNIRMRVWERGSGETWACGTGACATAVAAILEGRAASPVTVHLNGGDLLIEWDGGDAPVYMTGPATEVFSGDVKIK
ncbi:MAG: diaminopimelate epimerase [Lachnospiraceae bacterium]|nr:diaminopimelate epimerase [Lachnospiraceae bacterium]